MKGKLWTILGPVLVLMQGSLVLAQQPSDVDLGLGILPSTRPSEQMRIMQERNALLQSTGPVDPDTYILGPGDLVGMEVPGALSISAEDVIGADGSVTFPQIGTLWLGGLTLTEARVRVSRKSENLLRGVQPQLLLKAMRTFKVHVLGFVVHPGSQVASPQTRVSEIIQAAGGFTPRSDTRNIRITHPDGTTLTADLLPFFIDGNLEKNPRVRDGDVILIPPRTHTLDFSGPLLHPGRYDFVEGDELGAFLELLRLHPRADRRQAVIQRYTDASRWDTLAIDLAPVLSGVTRVPLHPDDKIMLRGIGEWHADATAEVRGAVRSPGVIPIVRGEVTVGKAVRMAGGFLDDAEPERVILGRPFLPDSTILPDPSASRNYVESLTATRLHERVVDLSLNDGPVVEPGDVITVPRFEGWVEVLGQVKRPGFYDYQPGRLTEEYIEAAGGFAKLADKSRTRVSRGRFGDIGYARDVDVPAPGDVIWVPEKVPVTFWSLTRDILSVTSQAAALVLVIREIAP